MSDYQCRCDRKRMVVQHRASSREVFAPPPAAMAGRPASFVFLASALAFAASFTHVHAASTTLTGNLDRIGVTTVGTGVADGTKYMGADLAANTKQANDYARKYSKDYTLFSKYEIVYDTVNGNPVLDATMSTIVFSMPTFRTSPIGLTKVTGDFTNNKFTRFEFQADKWYPNLERDFAIKNGPFKGFIDLADPKKPVVDITAIYEWQEVIEMGVLKQPLATLTYKTTAKENPGLGEWNPFPPGPVPAVPEPRHWAMLLIGVALVAWQVRRSGAGKSPARKAGRS